LPMMNRQAREATRIIFLLSLSRWLDLGSK
jgi:hypothetical protein